MRAVTGGARASAVLASTDSRLPDGTAYAAWEQALTFSKTYYVDNGDPWFNVLDFPGTPDHNGNGYLDPEDLIVECSNGVDDDGNGYVDDICGWDFLWNDNDPFDDVYNGGLGYSHGTGESRGSQSAAVCPRSRSTTPVMPRAAACSSVRRYAAGDTSGSSIVSIRV